MLDCTAAFARFPVLHTPRFLLREFTLDDAPVSFAIMGDPQVVRYFGRLPMEQLSEAEQRIERIRAAFAAQEGVRWAIVPHGETAMIGSCGFWRLDKPNFRAEVGYELTPDWWGRGVMPEVLAAALDFAFGPLGLHSVEAQIHPANHGSRRVLEKVGFVQEGYLRENFYDVVEQGYTDTAVFGILRAEWGDRGLD